MTTATSQGEAHEVAKENKKAIQARNLRTGVLFTAPALIVLAIFCLLYTSDAADE